MDKALYEKVVGFRTAMSLVKETLRNGVISEEDFRIICPILAQKYGLNLSTIFSDIDLLSVDYDGNMRHD